jgi:Rod binding domain-containing protein
MLDSIASLATGMHSIAPALKQPGTASSGATAKDDPEKIHKAAQQFESLLISEILKTAHSDSEGWLGTGDDQAGSSAMAIAEEQFAQALSNRGGLGLAPLIEKGLTKSTNGTGR